MRKIPESDDEKPDGEREPAHDDRRNRTEQAPHNLVVRSQHTPCATWGGGGRSPLDPRTQDTARRRAGSDPPSSGCRRTARRQEQERRAAPGVRDARSPAAVNRFAVLRFASALRVTAATDRAGLLMRASRKAGPLSTTQERSAYAAPLSR